MTSGTSVKKTELLPAGGRREALLERLPASARAAVQGRTHLALILITRGGCPFTMLVDGEWIIMAQEAQQIDPSLVRDVSMPTSALLAVVSNWPDQWLEMDWASHITHRADGVLRLEAV